MDRANNTALEIHPGERIHVMGILNVTQNSFSDGGKYYEPSAAIAYGLQMSADGAEILDLGAESTRPGSQGIPVNEQLFRLLPVIKGIRAKSQIAISIDTQSAEVAAACLAEGADIINDVSALRSDPEMLTVVAQTSCKIILMHMQGTPATMQIEPKYSDVIEDITEFFVSRIDACVAVGIDISRLWLDPGIGFGKTFDHNLELLRNFELFKRFSMPLVAGVSRKGILGTISGRTVPSERDSASIAAGVLLAQRGADVLRVHNVPGHVDALKVLASVEHLCDK